jgi:hypothetical protein
MFFWRDRVTLTYITGVVGGGGRSVGILSTTEVFNGILEIDIMLAPMSLFQEEAEGGRARTHCRLGSETVTRCHWHLKMGRLRSVGMIFQLVALHLIWRRTVAICLVLSERTTVVMVVFVVVGTACGHLNQSKKGSRRWDSRLAARGCISFKIVGKP